jgi:hypothetical protein
MQMRDYRVSELNSHLGGVFGLVVVPGPGLPAVQPVDVVDRGHVVISAHVVLAQFVEHRVRQDDGLLGLLRLLPVDQLQR